MATLLPMRPLTNSTSTSTSATPHRQPSLTSFPSTKPPRFRDDASLRRQLSNGSSSERGSSPRSSTSSQAPHRPRATHARPTQQRRIRPQYPRNSTEKHVEYILVASFDIDRGSVMEHQYPGPVGGDEHMLAELMLPDQAHVRSQDWTIFFLHKDAEAEDEDGQAKKRRRKRRRREADVQGGARTEEPGVDGHADGDGGEVDGGEDSGSDDADADDDDSEMENLDGPPLVYVLNLVNTKQDNTVKRGAIVRAMAICTRHSFLHIYKPLLLLALEQYFAHPTRDTLASLYDAVNNMDLSLVPRLSPYEKSLLQTSNAKDLFIEKFEAIIAQRVASSSEPPETAINGKTRYGLPRDTHEFESVVKYASIPVPVKIPVALWPEVVGDFSLIKLIATFSTPHTAAPQPFSPTHPHLTTAGPLTHPLIVLLNALLTQKRIIFLGHNLPSSEVAEAVLAACALASGGLLRGFTRHAFPYTDLTKIDDLLQVPGFIAGVTNPAFANKHEWWDLLCDLGTGRMKLSTRHEPVPATEGVVYFAQQHTPHAAPNPGAGIGAAAGALSSDPTGDAAFMTSVLATITERHGENALRAKFRRWVVKFTRLAAAFEEAVYGASALHIHAPAPSPPAQHSPVSAPAPDAAGHGYVWPSPHAKAAELAANAARIEGWRATRSYYNFVQDLAALYLHRPVKTLDLQHLHDKLAKLRLTGEQSAQIYLAVCAAVGGGEAEICQLLAVVANGSSVVGGGEGLFYLALGLWHPRRDVREAVAGLLARVREHEAGRHFWAGLGGFARAGWERVVEGSEGRVG